MRKNNEENNDKYIKVNDKIDLLNNNFDINSDFFYDKKDGNIILIQNGITFEVGTERTHKNGMTYEDPNISMLPALKLIAIKIENGKNNTIEEQQDLDFLRNNFLSPTVMEDFEKMKEKRLEEKKRFNRENLGRNMKEVASGIGDTFKGDFSGGLKRSASGIVKSSVNVAKVGSGIALKVLPKRISGPISAISSKIGNTAVKVQKTVKNHSKSASNLKNRAQNMFK